ncbi:lytic transglycosylase domain-containing protein [Bacteriovorax sp. BSW11_IV]|uniref:lytic transglycosylase domain-containing protein n=1 Tax=Bacteriovorax sp. BSW11_IV TaxID=1353529 RepID=UPI0009DB9100|nr:transglycosylase SLT domain-containing protein [Bacteriovorax sp. BSW11_IV]
MKLVGTMSFVLLYGCAGPANPFGAKAFVIKKDQVKIDHQGIENRFIAQTNATLKIPTITFDPPRKYYHEKGPLKIKVHSPLGLDNATLQFYYNKQNVTSEVLQRAKVITDNNTTYEILIKRFKLPLSKESNITVKYNSDKYTFEQDYSEPECNLRQFASINNTGEFNVKNAFIGTIQGLGKREGINPSLMAGLIAKESGFNPHAVSYAKAIGLTQVTKLAGSHILDKYDHWPEYPGINEFSVPTIKTLITLGKINNQNEWRLDKSRSILGGMTYLKYLEEYWNKQNEIGSNIEEIDLILASYNSGPYRVKKAVQRDPKLWNYDSELNEANKYVKMVKSYCDAFASPY